MLISEQIARIIEEMLDAGEGTASVQRNDLAQTLGCVPSQISYVISSRFTPERGYITESHRGGGGYIKIVRVPMSRDRYLMHFYQIIGDSLTENESRAFTKNLYDSGIINDREATIISHVLSSESLSKLSPEGRNIVRADIMRHIIRALMI